VARNIDAYCVGTSGADPGSGAITTRRIEIGRGLAPAIVHGAAELVPSANPYLLVCDRKSWEVVGAAVADAFLAAGLTVDRLFVIEKPDSPAVADRNTIGHLQALLDEQAYAAVLAVGAGTVNDIVKVATFQAALPYLCVATAPTTATYTAASAEIHAHGLVNTEHCHMPVAAYFDLDLMVAVPPALISAGVGDLIGRELAWADAQLAAALDGSTLAPQAQALVRSAHTLMAGRDGHIGRRDPDAVAALCEALALMGFAMSVADSAAPLIGAERLMGDYMAVVAAAQGETLDNGGTLAGVCALVSAAFYEQLGDLDPMEIEMDRLVMHHLPWTAYERTLQQRFVPYGVSEQVVPLAQRKYPSRHALRSRLGLLLETWSEVLGPITGSLASLSTLQSRLIAAQAPHTFQDLGLSPVQVRNAVLYAKDLRSHYTVLDLLDDLGLLETWVDVVLAPPVGILCAKPEEN